MKANEIIYEELEEKQEDWLTPLEFKDALKQLFFEKGEETFREIIKGAKKVVYEDRRVTIQAFLDALDKEDRDITFTNLISLFVNISMTYISTSAYLELISKKAGIEVEWTMAGFKIHPISYLHESMHYPEIVEPLIFVNYLVNSGMLEEMDSEDLADFILKLIRIDNRTWNQRFMTDRNALIDYIEEREGEFGLFNLFFTVYIDGPEAATRFFDTLFEFTGIKYELYKSGTRMKFKRHPITLLSESESDRYEEIKLLAGKKITLSSYCLLMWPILRLNDDMIYQIHSEAYPQYPMSFGDAFITMRAKFDFGRVNQKTLDSIFKYTGVKGEIVNKNPSKSFDMSEPDHTIVYIHPITSLAGLSV